MRPSLLIVSVYRPDLYEDAIRSIGIARDVEVVMDRRFGERRSEARMLSDEDLRKERRRMRIDEQLRTDGCVLIRGEERDG
jgi:hypothetical protein